MKGFTLLEILVSTALVALALLALIAVIISGLRLLTNSGKLTVASQLAREEMETIKKRGYANITVGTNFKGAAADPATGFPPPPYPGRDEFKLVVNATTYSPTLRQVNVEVLWGQRGRTSLTTLIHQ